MQRVFRSDIYSRGCGEELLPLVPLMMWMLSPALILVCGSDELFAPGITISKHEREDK